MTNNVEARPALTRNNFSYPSHQRMELSNWVTIPTVTVTFNTVLNLLTKASTNQLTLGVGVITSGLCCIFAQILPSKWNYIFGGISSAFTVWYFDLEQRIEKRKVFQVSRSSFRPNWYQDGPADQGVGEEVKTPLFFWGPQTQCSSDDAPSHLQKFFEHFGSTGVIVLPETMKDNFPKQNCIFRFFLKHECDSSIFSRTLLSAFFGTGDYLTYMKEKQKLRFIKDGGPLHLEDRQWLAKHVVGIGPATSGASQSS